MHRPPWEQDPSFADLHMLASRLEALVSATNGVLLKATGLSAETIVGAFAQVQVDLLRLDEHGRVNLQRALEEKRVQTLAQGNIFMACTLVSAVALSEFKRLPRATAVGPSGWLRRAYGRMQDHSTTPASLGAFATVSFYTLLAKHGWTRFKTLAAQKRRITRLG